MLFPLDDQQPSTSVIVTASESDGNGNNNNNNNNNASVDRSSEISDSELFPEDDTGSEYVGLTSESETSDYTSAGEDFPLPRKIFMKKKSKPGAEASKLRGENLKTVACTATGRVQMLGSGALTPTEVFKTVTNKKNCRPYCHCDKQECEGM